MEARCVIKSSKIRHKLDMTENELVGKIRELRQIRPRKDWVFATKSQILGDVKVRPQPFLFPFFQPVYAGFFLLLVLIGLLEFSFAALPGELLFPLKRIVEKTQAIFVSEEEKSKLNLELVNKRLEELNQIAEKNDVRKLAPALKEYQNSVSEAAKNLTEIGTTTSDPVVIQKIVEQTQKLSQTKEKVEALGVAVGEAKDLKDLEDSIPVLIVRQIEIWKTQINNLSDELEIKKDLGSLLDKAEEYYKAEDYSKASQILVEIYLSYPHP